jgi:large subunit ribosomal protein L21
MFAVIKTGGRQYRVVPEDVLEIGKIKGDVGTIVQLGEVLLVGGDAPVLGAPLVSGASVAAEVLDHKRGPKVIAFKKRRRKNSRRKRGYRDEITVIRVTEILTDGKAPSVAAKGRTVKPPKAEATAATEAAEPEADEAAAKKPKAKAATKPKAAARPKAAPKPKAAAKPKSKSKK